MLLAKHQVDVVNTNECFCISMDFEAELEWGFNFLQFVWLHVYDKYFSRMEDSKSYKFGLYMY